MEEIKYKVVITIEDVDTKTDEVKYSIKTEPEINWEATKEQEPSASIILAVELIEHLQKVINKSK